MTACANCRGACTVRRADSDGRPWCGRCRHAADADAVDTVAAPAWLPATPEYDGLRAVWRKYRARTMPPRPRRGGSPVTRDHAHDPIGQEAATCSST